MKEVLTVPVYFKEEVMNRKLLASKLRDIIMEMDSALVYEDEFSETVTGLYNAMRDCCLPEYLDSLNGSVGFHGFIEKVDKLNSEFIWKNLNYKNTDGEHIVLKNSDFQGTEFHTIDLSGFEYPADKCLSYMFSRLQLEELKLGSLDTSCVEMMDYMFNECESLEELNLGLLDTSCVKTMSYMFNECWLLKKVNISGFNTSKVTNMSCMFYDCLGLRELDLSSFTCSSLEDVSEMFSGCKNLKRLDLSGFEGERKIKCDSMFYGCDNLEEVVLSESCPQCILDEIKNEFGDDIKIIWVKDGNEDTGDGDSGFNTTSLF